MASKVEITADIRRCYGNALSQRQAKEYLGMGNNQIQEFLIGVPFIQTGRKKRFLAIDLARRIYEEMQDKQIQEDI